MKNHKLNTILMNYCSINQFYPNKQINPFGLLTNLFLRTFFLIICILPFGFQTINGQEIFKIGGKSIDAAEFKEVYLKNNPKAKFTKEEVGEYLELFKTFQLKKQEAYAQKLDTLSQLKQEYMQYVEQLIKNTFTDKSYQEQLVEKILARSKNDRKVLHILIKVPNTVVGKDTIEYYNKIDKIRKNIQTKEDFEKAAAEFSEDLNSKANNGSIGFINVFMTFPQFEEYAYSTPLGQVSPIFQTPNGYHILMPVESRPERGTIRVAHIYSTDQTEEDKKNNRSQKRINAAYDDLIKKKISFEKAVDLYSDDRATVNQGGALPEFGINQMVSEFEEACFSLTDTLPSKPFKSSFGWHIVKLIEHKKPLEDAEKRKYIRTKLEKDERMSNLGDATMKKIAQKIQLKEYIENPDAIFAELPDTFFATSNWKLTGNAAKILFTIDKTTYTEKEFAKYISENYGNGKARSKSQIIPTLYKLFKEKKMFESAEAILTKEDTAFRSITQEYKDGLMIFELMEREVWQKSMKDTAGIQNHYQATKQKYQYDYRAKVSAFYTMDKNLAEKINKEITENKKSFETIKNELKKTKDSNNFYLLDKVFEKGENPYLDAISWEENKILPLQKNNENYFVILKIKEILPPSIKPLNEVRGRVAGEYQKIVEENWLESLRKKYPIQLNQKNIDALIKK